MAEVKFCGMTREVDVREAARLGASYVGAIMTESPRRITPERAAELFESLAGSRVRSVAVFGGEPFDEVIQAARIARCDVIQLHVPMHGEEGARRLRGELGVEVWHVVRVGPEGVSRTQRHALAGSDGVLLDTLDRSALGGTGTAFDWDAVAADVRELRAGRRLIVAGGLKPENVRAAIDRLAPDVVDVSSGVESAPGVKDHRRMVEFMTAVRQSTSVPIP